jgi:hypothetical protein
VISGSTANSFGQALGLTYGCNMENDLKSISVCTGSQVGLDAVLDAAIIAD